MSKPRDLTTEQLGAALIRTIRAMSPEEKAAFRARLDKSLEPWRKLIIQRRHE